MPGIHPFYKAGLGAPVLAALVLLAPPRQGEAPITVSATLSEWKVELSERHVPAGKVTFSLTNSGSVPHQFEVEGQGIEKEAPLIQPGATATLTLTLKPGHYEIYCPVGNGSHKHLGMETALDVGSGEATVEGKDSQMMGGKMDEKMDANAMKGHSGETMTPSASQALQVNGGGPVIQILPGAFPFPDSAGPILQAFGEEHEALESQAQNGPYSNNVAPAQGSFTFSAWDFGPVRDSVAGTALVTTKDGTRWKVVMDRVQTKDVPHHPKFGGVIMGLYYHGATQVHTPLVPTINSAVALWAFAHLYKNDTLVTDNAWVHVMLLSRTRHPGDWKLACWDCSNNPIEELQLQVTSAPGD